MGKLNVFIDTMNIFHRTYHVMKGRDDSFTLDDPALKSQYKVSFMQAAMSLCRKFKAVGDDVGFVFCLDSRSFRYDLLPGYKEGRREKEQGFREAMEECADRLKREGVVTARFEGFEADDLLAIYAEMYHDQVKVLVSNDEDVRQLVDRDTFVYTANSMKERLYCADVDDVPGFLENGFGLVEAIDPGLILTKKVLLGCKTDNVPRLLPPGHGDKKVEKVYGEYLSNGGDIFKALSAFKLTVDPGVYNRQVDMVKLDCGVYDEGMLEGAINTIPFPGEVDTDWKLYV